MGRPMTEAGKIRRQTSLKLDDAMDLRRTIDEVLVGLGFNVETDMKAVLFNVSKEAVKKLKEESKKHGWTKYGNGWTYEKKPDKKGHMNYVLYNKKYGPLTHLLENGHEKVLWGKSTGERVDGIKHIEPVNAWLEEEVPKAIEDALNQTL